MKPRFLTMAICTFALFSVDLTYGHYPVSPYAYANNNPVRYVDPDGRKIRVANNHAGAMYNMAKIVATQGGRMVSNQLINSNHIYDLKGTFFSARSSYEDQTRTIRYVKNPWMSSVDGGSFSSEIAMGHEMMHAFQHDKGQIRYYNGELKGRTSLEEGAVGFANYLRESWGEGPLRDRYNGLSGGDSQNFSPYFGLPDAKITDFSNIDSSADGLKSGFSYVSKAGGKSTTCYIEMHIDDKQYLKFRIYDNEDEYREAISNW